MFLVLGQFIWNENYGWRSLRPNIKCSIIENQDIVAGTPDKIVINICFLAGGDGDPRGDHTEIQHQDTPARYIMFRINIWYLLTPELNILKVKSCKKTGETVAWYDKESLSNPRYSQDWDD